MATLRYSLPEFANIYERARILSEETSQKDPESDPYKSKYEARELFQHLKADIQKYNDDDDTEQSKMAQSLLAAIEYHLGSNYIETDELSTGEEHLCKCLKILRDRMLDPECCGLYLCALNQLGILWAGRGHPKKAMGYLLEAENIYKKYKHEIGLAPYEIKDLFLVEIKDHDQEQWKSFEKTFTHTLYYLAQMFGNLNDAHMSAKYCHTTLRRQLESKQYDALDWALNSATLSQYYITKDCYSIARHLLASSSCIIEEAAALENENEGFERIVHRKADIARCWAKYGLALLQASKDKLLALAENDETPSADNKSNENKDELCFSSLELTSLEEQITEELVSDFDQARSVFLNVQKWLNSAKEYYTLDGQASDYVQIIQDISCAFKLLAFFENNSDRRCKMHKRRIDLLESVLQELNPQYYLLVCRQLMFELAETYSEMMDIKMMVLDDHSSTPSSHAAKKINHLILQSIKYFENFIDSLRDSNKKMPEIFDRTVVRPALVAHFCMARLFSKIINNDVDRQIYNMKKSLECYNFIINYCEKDQEAQQIIQSEYDVCREMANLLPLKLHKVISEAYND